AGRKLQRRRTVRRTQERAQPPRPGVTGIAASIAIVVMPSPPPLSLYIHLPWCVRKCPYCDFNSHALRDELPEDKYVTALLADLDQEIALVGTRPVHSVF